MSQITKTLYPAHTQTILDCYVQKVNLLTEPTTHQYNSVHTTSYQNYVQQAQSSKYWKGLEYDGFTLPAQGQSKEYCKKWISFGCDNLKKHPKKKHYAEHRLKTCKVSSCPLCFESWIGRQANRTARRLSKFVKRRKFKMKHITLSPPQEQAKSMSYDQLKKWLNFVLKVANIQTASVIFHPSRFEDRRKSRPYISPHFHLLVYGRITNTTEFYNKTKWVIKNRGDLKTDKDIFTCTRYLLSHCGVKKGTHTVRYLGEVSYRKLKVEKEPKMNNCPYCDLPLRIFYINFHTKHKPPPIDHVGLWYSSCFSRVDYIDNDTKIPFYEMNEDPKSDIEYKEKLIYSFEELLLIKTNSKKIADYKYEMSLLKYPTSIKCQKITSFS